MAVSGVIERDTVSTVELSWIPGGGCAGDHRGVAQLMVVLDATIVTIALPKAQEGLGITDANRSWAVTA